MPTNPKGKGENYYEVGVDCASSATKGLWDYNAWKLNLDYVESNSKCTLTFTSKLSKEDYDEYIEAGVQTRRNTYRGKNITEYKKLASDNKMNLYNQISNCTFDDIYVGDYIESETKDANDENIIWLIADINNYRYMGYDNDGTWLKNGIEQCHATIIPAKPLMEGKMNSSETTKGGYYNSYMVQNILGMTIEEGATDVLNKYIVPDFKNHLILYKNSLSDSINDSHINTVDNLINGKGTGASNNTNWYSRYLDLMSEVNVFGSTVWSSSGYDVGIDNRQYAIFALKPEFISGYKGERFYYWLKAVANKNKFVYVVSSGGSGSSRALFSDGIRPRFLIG